MRTKNTLAALVGSATLVIGGYASAETLSSTEVVAPIHKVLPQAYGNLQLRQKSKSTVADKNETSGDILATVGSTFFDDAVSVEVSGGAKHHTDTTTLISKSTDVEVYARAFGNETASLQVFNETSFNNNKDRTADRESYMGIYTPVVFVRSTAFGTLTLGAGLRTGAMFYSEAQQANVDNSADLTNEDKESKKLSLVEEAPGEYTATARAVSLRHKADAEVKFQPNMVNGLSLELKISRKALSTPVHEVDSAKQEVKVKKGYRGMTAYDNSFVTASRFRTRYDLNPTVFLQNDLVVYSAKDSDDRYTYTNTLGVGTNLF